jgi:hypothetical protein
MREGAMGRLSIRQAAFAGFKLLAKRPGAAVVWYALCFGYLVGIGVLAAAMAGEAFQALSEMQDSGQMDPTSYMQVTAQTGPFTLAQIVLGTLFNMILTGAILRAILRPAEKGLAFLRLGAQELRLAVVLVVVTVISFLGVGAVVLLGMIAAGIMAGTGNPVAGGIVALIAALGATAAGFFFYVKFMFSTPQTVHDKAIRIFESWGLTKPQFGRLLGALLLALLALVPITVIAMAAVSYIGISVVGIDNANDLIVFATSPAYTVEEMLSAPRLASSAITALLWVISFVVTLGLSADAYQQVTGAETITSIFSDDDDDEDDENED